MTDILLHCVADRVATLTLNRPDQRNALSPELADALIEHLRSADADPQVKCIVIRGEGEHFSAGGDIKGFAETLEWPADRRFDFFERKLLLGSRLPNAVLDCRKPVVVATRGAVAGGALALCLAADFVIAGRSSFFMAAQVLVGLPIDCGLGGLLVGAMGIKAAKRLSLLGDRVDAEAALALGMVTELADDGELAARTDTVAKRLAAGPGPAMAATKALLNRSAYGDIAGLFAEEAGWVARCAAGEDFAIGIRSALNRTRPTFT